MQIGKSASTKTFGWVIPNDGYVTYHREDGPAYKFVDSHSVSINYIQLGKRHRYDGPAHYSISKNTRKKSEGMWFIRGIRIEGDEYLTWLADSDMDINNLSDNDKILIDLKWGIE